jgi:hypothetical protein
MTVQIAVEKWVENFLNCTTFATATDYDCEIHSKNNRIAPTSGIDGDTIWV